MDVEVGAIWRGTQRRHYGWLVRIRHVGRQTVHFEMVQGPAKSRGSRHWMRKDCFVQCFIRGIDSKGGKRW